MEQRVLLEFDKDYTWYSKTVDEFYESTIKKYKEIIGDSPNKCEEEEKSLLQQQKK